MTSIIDTTILAILSRYPSIPPEEAEEYISRIEHEENVPICHAVIGRIQPNELDEDARLTYDEFVRWSSDRTRRFRNEQTCDRYRRKENRKALRMTQLHESGAISDEMMLLYGMSGELPERNTYIELTDEEKRFTWVDRMESRFGPNWRERFERRRFRLPLLLQRRIEGTGLHNWLKEGF